MVRARISKMRNWPVVINHSVGRVPFLFRGHPERVRCLISLSDFERRCCTSHRVTTGYASRGGPRAWADALHRVTRTHTYALAHTCLSHSTTAPTFSVLLAHDTSVLPSPASSHYHTNCSQSTSQRFIGMSLVYWSMKPFCLDASQCICKYLLRCNRQT